jgi:aminoglycoside 6'-N-acetyltransferase
MSAYRFRPFTVADLPLAEHWLRTPAVVRWWGDPAQQLALVREDLDEPLMQQWIVEHAGVALAYLQAYPARAWPQSHLAHLPDGAQVIDTFIGEAAMMGRGHGSAYLRALAGQLLAEGASVVAIDPARDNHRARRASARAGFVGEAVVQAAAGAVVVMLFSRPG